MLSLPLAWQLLRRFCFAMKQGLRTSEVANGEQHLGVWKWGILPPHEIRCLLCFQTISCYPHKFPVIFLLIDVENIMISPLLKVITTYVSIRIGNVLSSSAFLPAAANLSISLLLGPLPGMPMVIPKTWTVSSASKPARCISCKAAGVRAPSCVFPGWVFNRTMFSNSCHTCKKDRNEGISLAAAARSSIYKVWNGVPKFLDIPHYQTHGFLESTNLPIHGFLQLWNQ